MTATEVAREATAAQERTPLPPGAEWQPIELDPNASYGRFSGLSMVEFQAACAWFQYALAAEREGDQQGLAVANPVLRAVPTWRTFSDPAIADQTLRDLVIRVVGRAGDGDFSEMESFHEDNCS